MRKINVVSIILVIAMIFSLSLTGCKENKDTSKGSDSGKDLSFPEVLDGFKKETGKKLTLIRPGLNPEDEKNATIIAIKRFEEEYGISVEVDVSDYDTWTQKIQAASRAGTPIDVIFGGVSEYPLFAIQKNTQPLKDFVNLEAEYTNQAANKEFFSFKNEVYNLSSTEVAPLVMYYNKELLENEGMEDPLALYEQGKWTFAKFKEMCKALTQDTDGDGNIDRWGLAAWYPWAFLGANKTALTEITEDGKYKLNMNTPAVLETLELIQDAYYTSKWRGLDGDSIFTSFFQGKNAFLNEYSWVEHSQIIPAQEEKQFNFEYGVAPMPYGPNNKENYNVGHASGYGIGTGSKNPYQAGQLISVINLATKEDGKNIDKKLPEKHVALYDELRKKVYSNSYYDSAINNGTMLFDQVCGGQNIQSAIAAVEPLFQDMIDGANELVG